jgi:hypothetical protein
MARGRRIQRAAVRNRKMRQRSRARGAAKGKRWARKQARIIEQRKSNRRTAGQRMLKTRARGRMQRQKVRARRAAQRQRQRTARQLARQQARAARVASKAAGGKYSSESTAARWAGIGQVADTVAGAIPGVDLGGMANEEGFEMPLSGSMDEPYGDGFEMEAGNGAGGWWADQTTPVKAGIVAAAFAAAFLVLRPKKKKKK